MVRWDPGAQDRLREAALALYLERGFDEVTVAEIAERAGLTRRTFFRHFADKREVFFAGSEQLPGAITEAMRAVDPTRSPIEAALAALLDVGTRVAEVAHHPRERRSVIEGSPDLQERERTKTAAVTSAVAGALGGRGVERAVAGLLAQVAVAVLQSAFERWGARDGQVAFAECFAEATADLRANVVAQL